MEEKKQIDDTDIGVDMIDETVIDTLKEMAIKHSNDSYVYRVFVNTIRLIYRLQSENAEQKAEIERLTEEKNGIMDDYQSTAPIILEKEERIAELQKQVESLEKANNSKLAKIIRLQEREDELEESISSYTNKAVFYYKKCKSYGIECFHDEKLEEFLEGEE